LSSSWHLCRPHPQGREPCRFAHCAIEQVRARHQRANGTHARSRRACPPPTDCRRGDRVRRREFITLLGGAASALPLGAPAEQAERVRRIGILTSGATADDRDGRVRRWAFLQGLRQSGWIDGRKIRIDYRWGAGDAANMRKYAAELVTLAPDVILASGTATVAPLLQATRTVPIVFVQVTDPVG